MAPPLSGRGPIHVNYYFGVFTHLPGGDGDAITICHRCEALLADKHEIEDDAIDRVADKLATLIEMCPSPQHLRDYIDEWAAERPDTPATRTQVQLVRKVADAMESGEL